MDFKVTKNNTVKLPLAKKYIKEDVNITVEVPIPEGYVKPEGELTITENGTYDVKAYESTEVNVPIPDGYIKPEGTIEIFEDGTYDITQYASANISRDLNEDVTEEVEEYTLLNAELEEVINSLPNVSDLEPVLQDKSVTPTTNTQNVTADDGYDGLGTVTVNPIPEEYIIPEGTLDITENGEYDVTEKSSVNVNISASNGEDMLQARVNATNSCDYLFYYYTGANIDFAKNLDTSNVTNMNSMFYSCSSLTTIPLLDTSNVTTMRYMFNSCSKLESIPQLNTSNVTNMNSMFYSCSSLTTIPLLDTSNVTDMSGTFAGTRLTTIPLLDTSNVTNMSRMFNNGYVLTTIPLLDTSNVTNMNSMFYNQCINLTTIPQLNTSNVTNMSGMFNECSKLESIPQLNTSNVTDMSNMFNNCRALKSILMYGMKVTFNISSSTQFETNDLVTILSNCQVITSSRTLTMGTTNLAKLEGVYVKPTGVELYEGITCNPCVICESTDEGAMLATDYFSAKGWTLA